MKRIGVVAGMLPLVLTAWLSPARADDPPADQAGGQSTTQPDQSQPQDQGDQQKKTEVHSTVTGPEGASATKDVTDRFVRASREVIVANPLDPEVADRPMVMGPVISAKAKEFILSMIDAGVKEGAKLALDGRGVEVRGGEKGHFIGPTVFTEVRAGAAVHQTEIFGPVQVILKAPTLEAAIRIVNDHPYGNGASIYTQNGYHARTFKLEAQAGMIGVNVGIPAPVAYLPFGGMKSSQFSHIKTQGRAIVNFFTQDKIVTERYWPEA